MTSGLRVGGEPGLGESRVRTEAEEHGAGRRHSKLWERKPYSRCPGC